jgi:hypothetical protein
MQQGPALRPEIRVDDRGLCSWTQAVAGMTPRGGLIS